MMTKGSASMSWEGDDLLEQLETKEEDEGILEELAAKRRQRQKDFLSVVNKRKVSKFELDEVML